MNNFCLHAVAAVAMAPELKLETKPDIFQLHLEPTSKNTNSTGQTLPPPPSPPKSDSTASTPKSPSSTESSKEKPPSENVGHRTKIERLPSFSGPDVLKKTVKDLQRSSVTLPRLQLLLEEVSWVVMGFFYQHCMGVSVACTNGPFKSVHWWGADKWGLYMMQGVVLRLTRELAVSWGFACDLRKSIH